MGAGLSAFGTKLKIGDGASPTEVFTEIAEVVNITGPSLVGETIDITNMSSTGKFREFIDGVKDGGEMSIEINFVPTEATHKDAVTGLLQKLITGALTNYEILFPDSGGTKWTLAMIVTGFDVSAPFDDKLGATVTFKVSGQPSLA